MRPEHYKEPANPVGTVAELFAGVGGFRLGLSKANLKTIYSNQWEPSTKQQHASECYVHNFGEAGHSNEDIGKVLTIPKSDILVGGFPCQDYSVAKSLNASKGLKGKKGVLWWDIYRLVETNRPKFIFLENVDRLLKSPSIQRGRDFAIMLQTLGALGYVVEWRVVNAADYGFPQRRIRVFIVATRSKRRSPLSAKEAANLLTNSGVLARAFPATPSQIAINEIDIEMDALRLSEHFGRGGGKSPFCNSGVYANGTAFTTTVTAVESSKKAVLGDVLISDDLVPEEYWVDSDRLAEWEYLKGSKSIERVHKASGTTYKYSEGRMAFPDSESNPSRTILTGEGGSTPSRFKHIIKRPRGYRRLVPVELERLNGFPDDWTRFAADGREISDARRAFFMGNALVVGLIERVGQILATELSQG